MATPMEDQRKLILINAARADMNCIAGLSEANTGVHFVYGPPLEDQRKLILISADRKLAFGTAMEKKV